MKIFAFTLLVAGLSASAKGIGQEITLSLKNAPLEKVFKEIERQSPYRFVYTKEQLEISRPVTVETKGANLEDIIQTCFKDQPLSFVIENRYILVQTKNTRTQTLSTAAVPTEIRGRVINDEGDPVIGATVKIKGTDKMITTNDNGEFALSNVDLKSIIVVSGAEIRTVEVAIDDRKFFTIKVSTKIGELDQVVMMAYGQTTKRRNTGNIGKVSSEDISKQPVSNLLSALSGRIPGLQITQTSGINGAGIKVQIRGQNSIIQGSEPFYIIDGVPFAPGNSAINQIGNSTSTSGISPFNLINPADIESIEILKDADATSIYGSRGANGVILITTKKGKPGKTLINLETYSGTSTVTRTMDMLNTSQYIAMRREGFRNDGLLPTNSTAPDILTWDTTRYTDLKKLFTGGTAHTFDAQLSISGGNTNTQFLLGAGFHRETTVLPTSLADRRASARININHLTTNKNLSINFSTSYSSGINQLNTRDLTTFINLPPNIKLFDSLGNLNWKDGGVTYSSILGDYGNPLAGFKTKYKGENENLISSLQLNLKLLSTFSIKINSGYNIVHSDEISTNPSTAIDPNTSLLPFSYFANATTKQWIIEPQIEFVKVYGKGKITVMAGSTWQGNISKGTFINASNYSSDIFINSVTGAGNVSITNNFKQYRYEAFFARLNYNLKEKYLLNLTARRDGSSRFGTDKQFANFGAGAFAWVFSNEKFVKTSLPFLSFGKLRTSYGITGSDQIGDYKYLDSWTASATSYQGNTSLNPSQLFNPDYSWESNKKFETAFDAGLFKDRILFSIAYFVNNCGNQIIQYSLPIQTGFNSIGKNLDARIRNSGFEFSLNTKNISGKVNWTSSLSLSITKNKLLSFPNLASSTYSNTYVEGQPLSVRKVYQYLGLDSLGVYSFTDFNKDGKLDINDRTIFVNNDAKCYGGISNLVTFKQFQLDIFCEFRKQQGLNYLNSPLATIPGYDYRNQPVFVLNRWQRAGDNTNIQRFTSTFGSAARKAGANLSISDALYSDASFIRFKNVSLAYAFPAKWLHSLHMNYGQLYIRAQNLFTITGYKGADPENQNMYVLPLLKTIVAGISLKF
jgi:TonB-linked SusC/RagA family outer membrane protein